jgi:hypothetical protein
MNMLILTAAALGTTLPCLMLSLGTSRWRRS